MARTPKEVTDAELAVLEVLWERGEATVREVADVLYPGVRNSEAATVQKLCERLLHKRYVARNRQVRPATFRAAVDRDNLIGRHLQGVADKLCSGSYTPLLTHLVEAAGLDPDDIRKLREQVDRARELALVRERGTRDLDRAHERAGDDEDRVRRLEKRVAHLTDVVERLARAAHKSSNDRRRESEEIEEEEIEEEEEVEEEIVEEKAIKKAKAAEFRKKKDAERKRRREIERRRRSGR